MASEASLENRENHHAGPWHQRGNVRTRHPAAPRWRPGQRSKPSASRCSTPRGGGDPGHAERKLSIAVQGEKLEVTVTAGPSTWSGLTTIQCGLILNDEILIRHPVTLRTVAGASSDEQTEYTLLNLMPAISISYSAG